MGSNFSTFSPRPSFHFVVAVVFLNPAILLGAKWYLIVVLISIYVIARDVEYHCLTQCLKVFILCFKSFTVLSLISRSVLLFESVFGSNFVFSCECQVFPVLSVEKAILSSH